MQRAIYVYFCVSISLLAAFVLMIFPMQRGLQWLRPDWLALVLIYWAAHLPKYIGVMTAFWVGLAFDILGGGVLGANALTLSMIFFMATYFRSRLRSFRLGSQLLLVLSLVGAHQVLRLCLQWIMGIKPMIPFYALSSLLSVILWPFVYTTLVVYQRKCRLA